MAKTRRNSDTPGDDLADGLAHLLRHGPWWLGGVAVAATYLGLAFALPALASLVEANGEGPVHALASVPSAFAGLLALGVACVWIVTLIQGRQDGRLLARQRSLEDLRGLPWRDFERLVAEAYRRRGYGATETVGGADGGVDVVLTGRELGRPATLYVQCKQWRSRQIGVRPVRELAGVVAAAGGQARGVRGVFVASGHYTTDAIRFAESAGVELVDGPALLSLVADARPPSHATPEPSRGSTAPVARRVGRSERPAPAPVPPAPPAVSAPASPDPASNAPAAPAPPRVGRSPAIPSNPRPARPAPPDPSPPAGSPTPTATAVPPSSDAPACPACSRPMVRRTARRGPRAGRPFWGCPAYPACRSTLPPADAAGTS